jgi:hypothetical protein
MGQRLTASFDELIRNRYGAKAADDPRFALRVEDLFAGYYGVPSTSQPPQGRKATSVVLSRTDDGETLRQRGARGRNGQTRPRSGQYVAQQSQCGCGTAKGGEYVARRAPLSQPVVARQQSMSPPELAIEECRVDLAEKAAPPASPSVPALPPPPSAPPETSRVLQPEVLPPERSTASSATDNDFLADMQSILIGQKVFDPATKKTVDKGSAAPPERPLPEAKNEQAIFDRIAQSMQYANAYDLGSIDLENRFADFDATSDRQERVAAARKAGNGKAGNGAAATASAPVGNEEFLHDLDEIRAPAVAQSNRTSGGYSAPLFATGEHVRTGGDLYPERFRIGRAPGVMFSYGQIITMADLYDTVTDMMDANPAELSRLKSLIEQDTSHYTTGSAAKVTTDQWQGATTKRYLKLAEDNYEHFSPNLVFKRSALARARRQHGDNKSAWERHHKQAIEEAQRLFLASPNQSVFYEWPLIINAFGDHFLTDAFAAGHLINKEVTIALFKSKFMKGTDLAPSGEAFFGKLASKAWKGNVARRFSELEPFDRPVVKWGLRLPWRPNIDSPGMLAEVLVTGAKQEPDRIANFVVEALHSHLNRTGIEVTNGAGDGTWTLMGDGHLDATNLPIIQRAVQQSVDNINDPAIMATNLNFGQFFARVWKHVPHPTAGSLATLERLTNDYTSPDSQVLVDAAAEIISDELDTLIQTLLDEHKLRVA